VVLRELRVRAPDDAPAPVEDEDGRAGGALVDGDNDAHSAEKERAPAPEPFEDERLQSLAHPIAQAADGGRIVGGGGMPSSDVDRLAGDEEPLRRERDQSGEAQPR